jgi:hypothetical protein
LDGRFKWPKSEHMLVPGQHVPIIDRETFERVQELLDIGALHGRPKRDRRIFLLTGLLVCGSCQRGCCGAKDYTKGRTGHGYRCALHTHGRHVGRRLDRMVLDAVAALPIPEHALDAVRVVMTRDEAGQPDRIADLSAQRKRHEDRRRRLTMFLADGTITPPDYRTAIAEVEQAMATIDRELAALSTSNNTTAVLADVEAWLQLARDLGEGTVAAVLHDASLEDQAAIVGAAVERVVLERGSAPVIIWRPWVERLQEALLLAGHVDGENA